MERMYENHTDKLASLNRKLEDLDAERVRTLDELVGFLFFYLKRAHFRKFLKKANFLQKNHKLKDGLKQNPTFYENMDFSTNF